MKRLVDIGMALSILFLSPGLVFADEGSTSVGGPVPAGGSIQVEAYAKRGRLDDYSNLESRSDAEKKALSFLFKKPELPPAEKFAVAEGPGTSGGGDVLKCGREVKHLLGPSTGIRTYFADTYELFSSKSLNQTVLSLPEEVWMEAIFDRLNSGTKSETLNDPGLGDLVRQRLQQLTFVPSEGPLPDLADDHISTAGTDCEKYQLAIQDLATGVVRVDTDLLRSLSYPEIFYFKVHEALVSLKKTKDDTTAIRAELRTAIANVVALDIISSILDSYIELPKALKMLWVLKVVRAHEEEFWLRSNCERERITDDHKCHLFLLQQLIDLPGPLENVHAFAQHFYKLFHGADLRGRDESGTLLREIRANLRYVAGLCYALADHVSPRVALVRLDKVDLPRYEQIHLEMVGRTRDLHNDLKDRSFLTRAAKYGILNYRGDVLPDVIDGLERDISRFKTEFERRTVGHEAAAKP